MTFCIVNNILLSCKVSPFLHPKKCRQFDFGFGIGPWRKETLPILGTVWKGERFRWKEPISRKSSSGKKSTVSEREWPRRMAVRCWHAAAPREGKSWPTKFIHCPVIGIVPLQARYQTVFYREIFALLCSARGHTEYSGCGLCFWKVLLPKDVPDENCFIEAQ